MDLTLTVDAADVLTVHLHDGADRRSVAVPGAQAGVTSLMRAIDDALAHGYGECFWPALEGGHYWWMARLDAETLELVTMWSRGGASGWQHVFRAVDSAAWARERLVAEVGRLGLDDEI